jgi:hypothetical protein
VRICGAGRGLEDEEGLVERWFAADMVKNLMCKAHVAHR